MAGPRWRFEDSTGTDLPYTFPINPSEGGSPSHAKTLTYKATAGEGGRTLIFEGRDEPAVISISGKILTEQQMIDLTHWAHKRNQIKLIDDLEREYWIYITKFTPKRVRAATRPWKHEYDMEFVILDWPDV